MDFIVLIHSMLTIKAETSLKLGQKIPIGSHIAHIYNDDMKKSAFLTRFVESGAENNEKTLYITDTDSTKIIRNNLIELGIEYGEERGILIDDTEPNYCPDGQFSPNDMMDKCIEFSEDALSEGYSGSRIAGEMSWALKYLKDSSKLFKYEAELNYIIPNLPFFAVCLYDMRKFGSETIMSVLKTHPMVMYNDGEFIENPYFTPVAEFLENYSPHVL